MLSAEEQAMFNCSSGTNVIYSVGYAVLITNLRTCGQHVHHRYQILLWRTSRVHQNLYPKLEKKMSKYKCIGLFLIKSGR